ncbi:MAG: tetratricopeptide repeat protein [Bryobacterales bacterium]
MIAQDPSNLEARLELGRALWGESGDREGAAQATAELLEIDPNNVDALYNMGAIHANRGQKKKAIEYWQRAAGDPASPSVQNAQNGLRVLGGAPMSIPDIPEHQNVRRTDIPDIPAHRGLTQGRAQGGTQAQPGRIDSGTRQRIIEFAATK